MASGDHCAAGLRPLQPLGMHAACSFRMYRGAIVFRVKGYELRVLHLPSPERLVHWLRYKNTQTHTCVCGRTDPLNTSSTCLCMKSVFRTVGQSSTSGLCLHVFTYACIQVLSQEGRRSVYTPNPEPCARSLVYHKHKTSCVHRDTHA